jgi:hypothetical protein
MQGKPIFRQVETPACRSRRRRGALLSGLAIVVLAIPVCACAALGDNSSSTESDRAAMNGTLQLLPAGKFTVHEIQIPSGTTIREYVAPAGTVFAVAWQGPVMPDLRLALGRYFDRYVAAATGKQTGHRQAEVREADFVVQSSGRMRSFSGRAFLPLLVPQGVAVEEIR